MQREREKKNFFLEWFFYFALNHRIIKPYRIWHNNAINIVRVTYTNFKMQNDAIHCHKFNQKKKKKNLKMCGFQCRLSFERVLYAEIFFLFKYALNLCVSAHVCMRSYQMFYISHSM